MAIPVRQLGNSGVSVSAIGIGGSSLGDLGSNSEAQRIVHEAIDAGVTFFDNAWEYHDGMSEERMGRALAGRRDKVFLMTKVCTHGRNKETGMAMLEDSLRRLQTDHLDLWQIHECIYDNDPDLHFAPDGVIEAVDAAKKAGKVRFVGFTGHKDPFIHLKMLSHDYPFDTVQMPLNPFDASYRSFQHQVLPQARTRGMSVIGMKSMGGGGEAIKAGVITPQEALRYAMSLPVLTTVSGIDSYDVFKQNLAVAQNFRAMDAAEMAALETRVRGFAGDGRFELYKSTKVYDAAVGRRMHKFPPSTELPA
jgi:aryl-alcohol dehydrogenase-like predicted oxidoreductase